MVTALETGQSISVILKLVADACNIACVYCYEKQNRESQPIKMPLIVAKAFIDNLTDYSVNVELHGGEPLLFGKNRIAELLVYLRSKSYVSKIAIQTNGLLLDDELICLFLYHDVKISVSIDGDLDGNGLRVDHHGRETFHETMLSIERLASRGLQVGIASVVTKSNVGKPESTLHALSAIPGVFYVRFIPCFDLATEFSDGRGSVASYAISPFEFQTFIQRVIQVYFAEKLFLHLAVDPIVSMLRSIGGKTTGFCVYDDKKCSHVFTLYPTGRLKTCDEFYSDTRITSNVLNDAASIHELINSTHKRTLQPIYAQHMKKCETCTVRDKCRGGCMATRELFKHSSLYDEYCDMQISLYQLLNQYS